MASPRLAGDPAQSSNGRGLARLVALGSHSLLVRGPEGLAQADQRQVRDRAHPAELPRRLLAAALYRPSRRLFRMEAIKGSKAKQPCAIAMKDGSRSASAGFGRNGKTRPRASGSAPGRSAGVIWTKRMSRDSHHLEKVDRRAPACRRPSFPAQ